MSDYYENRFNTLHEALEFSQTYGSMRKCVVFRGQRNAAWELKSNLFRGNASQEEINEKFRKTASFVQWCRQNRRLPDYSDAQLLQIAQHYGMYTDLLDFSTSPEIAAFFALGSPPLSGYASTTQERAAIFVLDPSDLEQLPRIADNPTLSSILPSLIEVVQQYAGAYQANLVHGLSRLVAQDGVFVRDVGGTIEQLTDPRMSLLPLIFEEEIGHPLLLKKVSFTPGPGDVEFLSTRGYNFDRIFPPPNDLEREMGRFFGAFSMMEYCKSQETVEDRVIVEVEHSIFVSPQTNSGWDSQVWVEWTKLNLSTTQFRRPNSRKLETWRIPESELYSTDPSLSLKRYVDTASKEGSEFKSKFELCVDGRDGTIQLPYCLQTLLEILLSFPYAPDHLELTIRKSIELFLTTGSLITGELAIGSEKADNILGLVFQPDKYWKHVDVICRDDQHNIKMMLPFGDLGGLDSVVKAVSQFQESDIGKEYGSFANTGYGLYCMMFHRPAFRLLFEPGDAIALWAKYAIPWQVRFGLWEAAVLNPFMVEYIGLS